MWVLPWVDGWYIRMVTCGPRDMRITTFGYSLLCFLVCLVFAWGTNLFSFITDIPFSFPIIILIKMKREAVFLSYLDFRIQSLSTCRLQSPPLPRILGPSMSSTDSNKPIPQRLVSVVSHTLELSYTVSTHRLSV